MDEYVLIGKIINTHGVKGELKVESHTDFEADRFKSGSTVYLSEKYEALTVKKYRKHQGFLLVLFEGFEDINLVEKFKGLNLYKSTKDIKALKDGEYYFKDLKGLAVFVEEEEVGLVKYVEEGSTCNYLRVVVDGKEKLVPFLKPFIKSVNLDEKRIDVVKMEGLL